MHYRDGRDFPHPSSYLVASIHRRTKPSLRCVTIPSLILLVTADCAASVSGPAVGIKSHQHFESTSRNPGDVTVSLIFASRYRYEGYVAIAADETSISK
jgi:hypothetical protein